MTGRVSSQGPTQPAGGADNTAQAQQLEPRPSSELIRDGQRPRSGRLADYDLMAISAEVRYVVVVNKKGQLSLTNPRDACETFARFM